MKRRIIAGCLVLSAALSFRANAADWWVDAAAGKDANDGTSAETAFATVEKAFVVAGSVAGDTIRLMPGTYVTDQQWGFDLKANLAGAGATRDEVVLKSAGNHRTLRMNATANPTVTNLTIVGAAGFVADKGGAVEMNGGTLVDCVVRDGTASGGSGNAGGGNLYVAGASVVENCLISGGQATKRGGNIYQDGGTVRNCRITGGSSENVGGNVYQYNGTIVNCEIDGGAAVNDGGNVRMNGGGTIADSLIRDGKITTGSQKKGANVYADSSGTISRCRLMGGTSEKGYDGGSLCVYSSSVQVEDTLVAGSQIGGVLLGGSSKLYNCTIVANAKYGVWSWTANQTMVNCVIFGNVNGGAAREWAGDTPTHSAAVFLNCATSEGSIGKTAFPTLVHVTEADFADFANGDYRPVRQSALVDAGASDPRGAEASATDLDGNPRLSGVIDIGCYEFQKLEMIVRILSAAKDRAWAPATVTFTHETENSASPENIVFTYDFGDGTATETTAADTISHAYAQPGIYTVKITAVNAEASEVAEMTYEGYVRVASSTVYVSPENPGAAFPYDTPETAYANLKTAVSEAYDGYTLLLAEGTYGHADQVSVTKALTIRGLGETPEAVVLRNTTQTPNTYYHRTLEVNNANALVCNLTLENGCVRNENGGNLRLVHGVVSNCVIRGGRVVADGGNGAGAGVALGGSGTVTHCVIANNAVEGTSSNQGLAGGAVFVAYGVKNARIGNSLVACNRYAPGGEEARQGAAGIRFGGGNDNTSVENCTIVSNVVEGALSDDSAGIHCTTWYGRLRNNIVAGNYETGKGRCTSAKIDLDHCTFANNLTDDAEPLKAGNFAASVERIFRDFAAGDFRLPVGSAAQNCGVTKGLYLLPAVDLAGRKRIVGRKLDVGCYECPWLPGMAIIIR